MRIRRRLFLGVLATLPLFHACGGGGERKDVLYVYAAASMQNALEELNDLYRREHGVKIVLNGGSSGTLSMQIEQGGRCDVFLSAGEQEMDRLDELGLVDRETRFNLLSNQLVLIVPAGEDGVRTPADLKGEAVQHLSIAHPESVPAGRYAKEWLEHAGLWAAVQPKLLPGTDVRAALSQVEFGGAEAGIVYRTDAAVSSKVEIAYAVPLQEGPEILYPAAALTDRPRRQQSLDYLAFLRSKEARAVFERFGFLIPEAS
jgi:molybdate transport system substrate-binding protein